MNVNKIKILNAVTSGTLPFDPLDDHNEAREELRLKHRYLDLRNDKLGDNIRLRSRVSWTIRDFLHRQGEMRRQNLNER